MGAALRYASSARIEIKSDIKTNAKVDVDGTVSEVYTSFYTKKCKVAEPYKTTYSFLNVRYDRPYAFNMIEDVIEAGLKTGALSQAGAYYNILDNLGNKVEAFQGRARLVEKISQSVEFYLILKLRIYSKVYEEYEFYTLFSKIVDVLNKEYYHTMKNIFNITDIKPFDIVQFSGLTIDKLITQEGIIEGQKYTSEILEIEKNYVVPEKTFVEIPETEIPQFGEIDIIKEAVINGKKEKYGEGGEIINEND